MSHSSSLSLPTIGGPAAWKGPAIDWQGECLYVLDDSEQGEVDRALRHLKSLGELDLPDITREAFPLDKTAGRLAGMKQALQSGRGFAMLRGLPRQRYSVDDMARIYFGIGAYLGKPMVQSYQGEYLGHVMDLSDIEDASRGYHSGGHMGMHTDSCDIVGLMCLRGAKVGGASRIASAVALHDELARTRPDVLAILYRGFYYRRMDLDAQFGSGRVLSRQRVPVFTKEGPAVAPLACYFLGGYARKAAARGDVTLADEEIEAIQCIERLAESPEFHLDMSFAEGDIQFLNNRVILHGRADYTDDRELAKRRHLLRLWFEVGEWPRLPEAQIFHGEEDHRKWSERRSPHMEMPSAYMAALHHRAQARQGVQRA